MRQTSSGLWVPERSGVQLPTRRDFIRLGAGAAGLALMPKPARATAWTFLRSAYLFQTSGTSGSSFTIDTSDAQLAVACSNYDEGPPYQFNIYEGSQFGPNLFSFFGPSNQGSQHTRLHARVLTSHSISALISWDTASTGSGPAILFALFGVSGTSIPGTSVQSNTATTPSQTTAVDDTLVVSACGHWQGSVPPSAVGSGFTGIFGSHQTNIDIACLAYKIEPTAGAANSPAWTITDGGPVGTLGVMFAPSAAPVSSGTRRRVIA